MNYMLTEVYEVFCLRDIIQVSCDKIVDLPNKIDSS